jgi:hypothetical protein
MGQPPPHGPCRFTWTGGGTPPLTTEFWMPSASLHGAGAAPLECLSGYTGLG